jgi:hypothetical protein
MVHRKRHRLFLVNVLPGFDGIDEMQAMQVLWRRDQYGIDITGIEHLAVIHVRFYARQFRFGSFELLRVDVGYGNKLRVRADRCFTRDRAASVAIADNTQAYSLVRSEDVAGNGSKAAETGGHLT